MPNVRFGSGADNAIGHVRFTPESRHSAVQMECPLRARSGHDAGALPPTQIIEGVQGRTDFMTDFRFRIDVLKSVNHRGIFGTQFFSQFVHFLKQLIELLLACSIWSPSLAIWHRLGSWPCRR